MFSNYKNTQTLHIEEKVSFVIITQTQYLIPNLLKNVVQLKNGKKVHDWGILISIW